MFQVFSGIDAVLFLMAASDFDQNLREDETVNRLKEAFKLFSDMCWSRYLRESGMIVFLNKQDLLKRKIENGHNIGNYFPEYRNYQCTEKINDEYEKAKFFMRDKILVGVPIGFLFDTILFGSIYVAEYSKEETATGKYCFVAGRYDSNGIA